MSNAKNRVANRPRLGISLVVAVSVFTFVVLVPISFDRMDVSGSLYAQTEDKPTKIEIEVEGKSDAEIKAEIEDKLREQGLANPDVTVTLKPDGMREIKVGIRDSTETGMKEKQIEIILPEDQSIKIKEPSLEISADSKDKTDEEIKEEIRQKLTAEGVQDVDISVTTDSSGERKIEIKMEKEDCDP